MAVEPSPSAEQKYQVTTPPTELNLAPFYKKYVDASGYPVVSSDKVNDYALREAAYLVDMMLAERPDLREAMVASGSRLIVISPSALGATPAATVTSSTLLAGSRVT